MAANTLVCISLLVLATQASGAIQTGMVSTLNRYISTMKNKISEANTYQFTNCGGPKDMATFKSLVITPDPISPPGDLTVSFEFDVHEDVTGPLDLNVTIGFEVSGHWYAIPCVGSFVGSCNYNDICPYLDYQFQRCPKSFEEHGIPCKCPMNKGNYVLPPTSVYLSEGLDAGSYLVKLVLQQEGRPVACGEARFTFA